MLNILHPVIDKEQLRQDTNDKLIDWCFQAMFITKLCCFLVVSFYCWRKPECQNSTTDLRYNPCQIEFESSASARDWNSQPQIYSSLIRYTTFANEAPLLRIEHWYLVYIWISIHAVSPDLVDLEENISKVTSLFDNSPEGEEDMYLFRGQLIKGQGHNFIKIKLKLGRKKIFSHLSHLNKSRFDNATSRPSLI